MRNESSAAGAEGRPAAGEPNAGRAAARRPGLYLHVPFCSAICPYCDFAVTTGDAARRRRFVDDLKAEIALGAPPGFDGPFDTVYFGGGTPSLLAPEELAEIVEALRAALPVTPDARLSLEANPEDVDGERVAAWRSLGVTTLSLGVQSFDDRTLGFLGRRHGGRQSVASVERSLDAGFETVSVDLIFGLPDDAPGRWRSELEHAEALGPDHVSCYQLTVHRGTAFAVRRRRGELAELPEAAQGELFRLTHRALAAAGYGAYEVSNFAAAPAHRSAHNTKYWDHTPYLGLGPSAHSFDGVRRSWNHRGIPSWREAIARGERPVAGRETLGAGELVLERLMLGLRTTAGVDLAALEERYGLELLAPNRRALAALEREGLVALAGARVVPTLDGLAVADSLAVALEVPSPRLRVEA